MGTSPASTTSRTAELASLRGVVQRELRAGLLHRDPVDALGDGAAAELAAALDALHEERDLFPLLVLRLAVAVRHEGQLLLGVAPLERLEHLGHDHGLAQAGLVDDDLGGGIQDAHAGDEVGLEREQAQRRRAVHDVRARGRARQAQGQRKGDGPRAGPPRPTHRSAAQRPSMASSRASVMLGSTS
jgi:hypothetical protein